MLNNSRLRLLLIPAGLLTALALHALLWITATNKILAGIPDFTTAAAADGWRIQADPPERAGYPARATIRLHNVTATRPLGAGALQWTAARVDLTIAPSTPQTLLVQPIGNQTITLAPGAPIPFQAAETTLRIPLSNDAPSTLTIRALDAEHLRVATIEAAIAPLATNIAATTIQLNPPLPPPFETGANLATRILITQPFPNAPTPAASAAAWQTAQGRIEAPEITLNWGPLDIAGNADGALDPQLQPTLQATLRVRGAQEALAALAKAGQIAPGPAAAARGVLGLLALAAQGGPIALPITLRDQTLTVAQFPLLRVPKLQWDFP